MSLKQFTGDDAIENQAEFQSAAFDEALEGCDVVVIPAGVSVLYLSICRFFGAYMMPMFFARRPPRECCNNTKSRKTLVYTCE